MTLNIFYTFSNAFYCCLHLTFYINMSTHCSGEHHPHYCPMLSPYTNIFIILFTESYSNPIQVSEELEYHFNNHTYVYHEFVV